MALSYRTETFRDTLAEIQELKKKQKGSVSSEDYQAILARRGVDAEDFNLAARDFNNAVKSGEDDFRGGRVISDIADTLGISLETRKRIGDYVPDFIEEGLSTPEMATRIIGRGVGDIGRGVINFGDAFLPEVITSNVSSAAEAVGEYIPRSVKLKFNELFDPYHGEGLVAGGEEVAGIIGSYLAPSTAGVKILNLGLKGAQTLSPATRAIVSKSKTPISKLGNAAKYGVAGAAAATVVEDPKENIANTMIEIFPESEQYLERFAVDPDDSEAGQYIDAFLNNLGFAGLFSPIAIAAAYKDPLIKATKTNFQKLPSFLSANLTSRRGTDDELLGMVVERTNAGQAALTRAEGLALDLKQAVKKEYGKESEEVVELMNKALSGDSFAASSLKGDVRDIILQMRQNISGLSKEVAGKAKGELKTKINKNLDTYVTRSYNLFDDPAYARNIKQKFKQYLTDGTDENGVFADAIKSLRNAGVKSDDEAINALHTLIRGTDEKGIMGIFDSLLGYGQNINSVKSGLKRNEKLPQSIRELLGEVKDPYTNYVKTFSNLSEITAETKYLDDVATHLQNKGLANRTVTADKDMALTNVGNSKLSKIFGKESASQMDNPLEGMYVDANYKNFIENGLDLMRPDGAVAKLFMRAKGVTQSAQTVMSPVTHGRNVMGNFVITLANGMIPVKGFAQSARAVMPKSITKRLLNKSNAELADTYARYVELGIANSGLAANIIRKNLSAFDTAPEKFLERTALSPLKKTTKKITDVYQAEDDFFKIAHFEKTLDYLKKSKKYKDLPIEDLEKIAAERTRDLMPNYNLVPTAVKALRKAPVGDFLSFPAEMTRISKNLVKYTLKDLTSGDATLFAEGAKRAAGITAAGVAGEWLKDYSMQVAGISQEQEEALNNVLPSWEYNQDRIYLSGLDEDERGRPGVDYVNLGPIDPFAYLKSMGKGMHSLILGGNLEEEYTDTELNKIALGTFEQAVGPFASPSMITDALFKTFDMDRIKREGGPSLTGKTAAALEPIIGVVTPKFIDLALKRAEYEKSLEKYGDYAIKPNSLATWSDGEVDMLATMGIKRQRADLLSSAPYAFNEVIGSIENSPQRLKDTIDKDPNLFTDEDSLNIYKLFVDTQKVRASEYERLKALVENYEVLYGDAFDSYIDRALTGDKTKESLGKAMEHIRNVQQGRFEPYELPRADRQRLLQTPIPWDKIDEATRFLRGKEVR